LFSLIYLIILNTSFAGTYEEVTNFGVNPSNIKMYLYTPDVIASKPAVLVACHCRCVINVLKIKNGLNWAH